MEKIISVVVAGTHKTYELAITPGTTPRHISQAIKLDDYNLAKRDGNVLQQDADVFQITNEFEKLYAVPANITVCDSDDDMENFRKLYSGFMKDLIQRESREGIGKDILKNLNIDKQNNSVFNLDEFLGSNKNTSNPLNNISDYTNTLSNNFNTNIFPNKVQVVNTRYELPIPTPRIKVRQIGERYLEKNVSVQSISREDPYWEKRGWEKSGRNYKGDYKTPYGNWPGAVKENFFGNYSSYIYDLPEAVLSGAHSACFMHKGKGVYSIHFNNNPKDIDTGILKVEQSITESFEKY